MKRALIVKALTDQILLARTDTGEILSLAVSCRNLDPGTMIGLELDAETCVVHSIEGKSCNAVCGCDRPVVLIDHKDDRIRELNLDQDDVQRHAI